MVIWKKKKKTHTHNKNKTRRQQQKQNSYKMTSISKYTEQKYGQKLQIINREDDGVSFLRN